MCSYSLHPSNRILYTIIVLLHLQTAIAQSVGIGTASPDPSARLEVNSTNQGILIPKLISSQRSAINNPAIGLLVFQTNGVAGFYYYTGTVWLHLTYGTQPDNEGMALSPLYGFTSTIAGTGSPGYADGIGTAAFFHFPAGLALDASDNLYVTDFGNKRVRKITPTGVVSTVAGSGATGNDDGPGTSASFGEPWGIAIDASGNVYVTDRQFNKIRKIIAH